jgi:hypothetical protein
MANNTTKSFNNVRDTLKNIPEDLFEMGHVDVDIKIALLKQYFKKNPSAIVELVKSQVNESK